MVIWVYSMIAGNNPSSKPTQGVFSGLMRTHPDFDETVSAIGECG